MESVSLSFYANTQTDFGRMVKVGNKTALGLVADGKWVGAQALHDRVHRFM